MEKQHMHKRWFAVFLLLIMSGLIEAHEQDLLRTRDISHVMQQILSEHVNKKEITTLILHHAFEIYINQFDPHRMYLLESEVVAYFKPTSAQLEQAMEQYKRNDFSRFKQLNQTIQTAIERSRRIRQELEIGVKNSLFHPSPDKEHGPIANKETMEPFASTKEQLEERILQNMGTYINTQKKRYGGAMTSQRKEQILHSYETKLREFENQYLYQNEKGEPLPLNEQESLFTLHVLKALANSLDAHTSFYEANEAYDIRVRLQKEFKGIGLVLKDANQGVVVTHMLEGGPAARSKLIELGDILIEIDGKSILDYPFEKTMEMLHGDKNTKIKLTFKRKINGSPDDIYTVELMRETIILNNDRVDVSSEVFGNGIIGIITLHSFYQGDGVSSEQDVRNAIQKLGRQGNLKGLILDLRDNGGGFLSQAVKVAGLFITDGIIVISKYSNGDERIYRDVDGKTFYDGPLVVLTSKATASAAEIVAQALQDYGVALIVGDEHTYGKGTIQTQTVTDNQSSSYFKVTVGKYYTVSGRTPQKEGVKADIVVPSHWNREEIGEIYADSLNADVIPPAYNDSLQDVPPDLRSWYIKYYIPKLQKRTTVWQDFLPTLRKNSEYRIAQNKNYQYFLKGPVNEEESDSEEDWSVTDKKNKTYGEDDLQVQEAVNILKDMIILRSMGRK
jgi:carboxyl-terminal processing protease